MHFEGAAPDRDQIHQLSAGIAHRGPDDSAVWAEGPAAMAQRRFMVRSGETQCPLAHEDAVLLMDGRVPEGGPPMVLTRWLEQGPEGLATLGGSFAFAIWSPKLEALWLIRDPCGSRPLFWAQQGHKVAFASEIPPLLGLPWVSREIADDHLAEYLSFRYIHAPRTLLRDVHVVPPGHILRIDAHEVRVERWWKPQWASPGAKPSDERDPADRLDMALRRSVERTLRSDVPLGLMLSGGLDSSAILHHARELGNPPPSFTVAFGDPGRDETGFAARVARAFDSKHHIIRVTGEDIHQSLDLAAAHMGHPMPSAAAVVQLHLFRQLRGEVRVLLSGDGGDEVLGGRSIEGVANRVRRSRMLDRLPSPARAITRRVARKAGFQDLATAATHFGRGRNIGGSQVFVADERRAIMRDPTQVKPGIRNIVLEPFYQDVDTDPINSVLHVWQRGWLPHDSLARSDRMAAHSGVEVRYPMLDTDLLRLTCAFPGEVKVRPSGLRYVTKALLRDTLKGKLPEPLLHRPKRAMSNPLGHWLRNEGRGFLHERIEALAQDPNGHFIPVNLRRLTHEHCEGKTDHGPKLWALILFGAWLDTL